MASRHPGARASSTRTSACSATRWRATRRCSRARTTSRRRGASSTRCSRAGTPVHDYDPGPVGPAGGAGLRAAGRLERPGRGAVARAVAATAVRRRPWNCARIRDADTVAQRAAQFIAAAARDAIAARGRFKFAVSGGHTPWQMLRALAGEHVDWNNVHLFQVDERVAPPGDPDRNLTHIRASLLAHARCRRRTCIRCGWRRPTSPRRPREYAQELATFAGTPPVLDLVHLGLGPDGHTASLVPGDPVLARGLRERRAHAAVPGPPADDAHVPRRSTARAACSSSSPARRRRRCSRGCARATRRFPRDA